MTSANTYRYPADQVDTTVAEGFARVQAIHQIARRVLEQAAALEESVKKELWVADYESPDGFKIELQSSRLENSMLDDKPVHAQVLVESVGDKVWKDKDPRSWRSALEVDGFAIEPTFLDEDLRFHGSVLETGRDGVTWLYADTTRQSRVQVDLIEDDLRLVATQAFVKRDLWSNQKSKKALHKVLTSV